MSTSENTVQSIHCQNYLSQNIHAFGPFKFFFINNDNNNNINNHNNNKNHNHNDNNNLKNLIDHDI